jgi:hypothetical protein
MPEENKTLKDMPKKACMVTIMFAVDTDDEAMALKKGIDKAIADKDKKRYTFQIIES